MFILEVHIIFFLDQLDHLIELIHVELPDERGEVSVSEEMREDLVLKFLGMLDEDFGVAVPGEILAELPLLDRRDRTSRIW